MGNGKQAAMSERGNRRTGCADIAGNRQRGSMLVLGISTLVICLLLLGLGVNLGYWNYKKAMVADAAEAIAPIALENQFFYRIDRDNGDPYMTTEELVNDIWEDDLAPPFLVITQFNFWQGDTYVGDDPDPAEEDERFNRIHIEVCTPLTDITGLFTLSGNPICALRVAEFDPDEIPDGPVPSGCYCEIVYCPVCCLGDKPPGRTGGLNLCSINSGNVEGSVGYKACTGGCNVTCGAVQLLGGLVGSLVTLLERVLGDPNASYDQYLEMMRCGLGGTLRGAIQVVDVVVDTIVGTAKEVTYTP